MLGKIWVVLVLIPVPVVAFRSEAPLHLVADPVPRLGPAQSIFALRCAGCHGLHGESVPNLVPTLRGRIGHFLCTSEGREYLVRVPNVALAPLNDEDVANLLNFVVFSLAPGTAPRNAPAYTAAEVKPLRARPLNKGSLFQYRKKVVEGLIHRCGAPESLKDYKPLSIGGV